MSKEKKQLPGKKEETCVIVDTVKDNELLNEIQSFLTTVQEKLIGIRAVQFSELNFGDLFDKTGVMGSIAESLNNEVGQFTADLHKKYYNK